MKNKKATYSNFYHVMLLETNNFYWGGLIYFSSILNLPFYTKKETFNIVIKNCKFLLLTNNKHDKELKK